jgi:hypothetical protein
MSINSLELLYIECVMPKRKVKEEKPRKRLGKKELLIPPAAMGVSLLITLVIIPQVAPPPLPLEVCLKGHNVDTFSIHPTVEVLVDGNLKQLPSGIGNETVDGRECLRPIHTDAQGNTIHIEYVRPIRLTLGDFMKIYSPDNMTISVVDNSSGSNLNRSLHLSDYDIHYSYYSDEGKFTRVTNPFDVPPFRDNMVTRIELTSR